MDPSAYGEAPEGAWTSGLREDQEVKTGVDVTASGPVIYFELQFKKSNSVISQYGKWV